MAVPLAVGRLGLWCVLGDGAVSVVESAAPGAGLHAVRFTTPRSHAKRLSMELDVFRKLPLGGVDRRSLVKLMAREGAAAAEKLLALQLKDIKPVGAHIADDVAVLLLGGSNGITRALALQLVFGEGAAVYGVHYDSAKMQIGVHHATAMMAAAQRRGSTLQLFNRDATRDKSIAEVVALLADKYRAVHLINGIAAGATKRYAKYGPTTVRDIDVAFDAVLQVPDFANRLAYRRLGLVEVEVASEAEIERTNKFMGTSTTLWVEALAAAGLVAAGESIVGFCDYDYEADDPVYGMGPLAGAKVLQREAMQQLKERYGIRPARICYPPMATTALGAIPGGMLMYALSAQLLMEQNSYRSIAQLAHDSMVLFDNGFEAEQLRLDGAYKQVLPEFHKRRQAMVVADVPAAFAALFGQRL